MLNVGDNLQNIASFIICHQFTGGYGEKVSLGANH